MTSPSNLSRAPSTNQQQIVQIISIDLIGLKAQGRTRQGSTLDIDLRYMTGAVHVIPSVNDQWMVCRQGQSWALVSQLPVGGSELGTIMDNPQQGTVQIGSTNPAGLGPLHLNGSAVFTNAPLVLDNAPTGGRPDAGIGAGAIIFDSTLGQIIFSTGITWTPIGTGGGGGTTYATVTAEVPTGTKDGSNTTFTVGHNFRSGTTALYRNGLREHLGVGYTEASSNTLSFSNAPLVDDEIFVDYVLQ